MKKVDLTPKKVENDDVWAVIEAFFQIYNIGYNQISQFNDFIDCGSKRILAKYGKFKIKDGKGNVKTTVEFQNLHFEPPVDKTGKHICPERCKIEKITYESEVKVDLVVTNETGEVFRKLKTTIGKIPVMTRSKLCNITLGNYDDMELARAGEEYGRTTVGGEFLVLSKKGDLVPRIIVGIERNCPNLVTILVSNKSEKRPSGINFHRYIQIQSQPENGPSTSFLFGEPVIPKNKPEKFPVLLAEIPKIVVPVPVFVLLRALGIEFHQVLDLAFGKNLPEERVVYSLQRSAEDCYMHLSSREDALKYLYELSMIKPTEKDEIGDDNPVASEDEEVDDEFEDDSEGEDTNGIDVEAMLAIDLLPHLGKNLHKKGRFICSMISAYYLEKVTNRDSYTVKTVAIAHLFTQQFAAAMRTIISKIIENAEPKYKNGQAVLIDDLINTNAFTECMRKGNLNNQWQGIKHMTAASQPHSVYNTQDMLANLRRSEIPKTSGNVTDRRHYEGSGYGLICPETPEGADVGTKKIFGNSAICTMGENPNFIKTIAATVDGFIPVESDQEGTSRIVVNGDWIGTTFEPEKYASIMRFKRRMKEFNKEISIAIFETKGRFVSDIQISTESGRYSRPLLIVSNGELVLKKSHIIKLRQKKIGWEYLESIGAVEFVDSRESFNANIIFYPSELEKMSREDACLITHCELHPSLMFGIGISQVPWVNHDPGARGSYTANMSKQAMGWPFCNPLAYIPSIIYSMYPQKSLCSTRIADTIGIEDHPAGFNAVTAFWLDPANPEDAIVANRAFLERGGYDAFEKKIMTIESEPRSSFIVPEEEKCGRVHGNPRWILGKERAIISEKTWVENGDILVGCVVEKLSLNEGMTHVDKSLVYSGERGQVIGIQTTSGGNGYERVIVHIYIRHKVEVGDKFAARHGQKGTLGAIYDAEDMPYSIDGMIPDIIWSPLATNSRMTIAMLLEVIIGKQGALSLDCSKFDHARFAKYLLKSNGLIDATPFRFTDPQEVNLFELVKKALKLNGYTFNHEFIDGVTGKSLGPGFIGLLYIQRLKHQAKNKAHARSVGSVNIITRQPTDGRSRGGGYRHGIQEVSNLEGNGAAYVLNERTFYSSDYWKEYFCGTCGMPVPYPKNAKDVMCRVCNSTMIEKIQFPFGMKIVTMENTAMNVAGRFFADPPVEKHRD